MNELEEENLKLRNEKEQLEARIVDLEGQLANVLAHWAEVRRDKDILKGMLREMGVEL